MKGKEIEDAIREYMDIIISTDTENVIFQYYPRAIR